MRNACGCFKELALSLPARAWRTITWREGSAEPLTLHFARICVHAAHRDYKLTKRRPEEWLLIEWPEGENTPTKYWLSTLAQKIAFNRLVDLTKLRWRIERDYQELKQEVGLGHFEGRGWRGLHHHATLCIAAYGFLISQRETIPPSGPRPGRLFPQLAIPRQLSAQRLRRCVPNATFQTRSPPCAGGWFSPWSEVCHDVRVAPLHLHIQHSANSYDAVRLGILGLTGEMMTRRTRLEQIAEAQHLAREWTAAHPRNTPQ